MRDSVIGNNKLLVKFQLITPRRVLAGGMLWVSLKFRRGSRGL